MLLEKDMVDKLATGLLLSINLSPSWVTNGLKGCIWTWRGGGEFTFYILTKMTAASWTFNKPCHVK